MNGQGARANKLMTTYRQGGVGGEPKGQSIQLQTRYVRNEQAERHGEADTSDGVGALTSFAKKDSHQ